MNSRFRFVIMTMEKYGHLFEAELPSHGDFDNCKQIDDHFQQFFKKKKLKINILIYDLIMLDLKKAFGCVRHKIIFNELLHCGVYGVPHKLLTSYLTDHKQFVSSRSCDKLWRTSRFTSRAFFISDLHSASTTFLITLPTQEYDSMQTMHVHCVY